MVQDTVDRLKLHFRSVSFSTLVGCLRVSLLPGVPVSPRCALLVFGPYGLRGAGGAAPGLFAGLSCQQFPTGRDDWLPWGSLNGTSTLQGPLGKKRAARRVAGAALNP